MLLDAAQRQYRPAMAESGIVPESPHRGATSKRRRLASDCGSRADACYEFAVERSTYKSIDDFIRKKRNESTSTSAWQPSKAQMSRDMRAIFGENWAQLRGGGGRGRCGGIRNTIIATGLDIPSDPASFLKPCSKPTVLTVNAENQVIESIKDFET